MRQENVKHNKEYRKTVATNNTVGVHWQEPGVSGNIWNSTNNKGRRKLHWLSFISQNYK